MWRYQPEGSAAKCSSTVALYKVCKTNCTRLTEPEAERCKASNGEDMTNWLRLESSNKLSKGIWRVVHAKIAKVLLQPLRWCCVDCVIHHERDVREEQHHRYIWREQAIIEWSWHVNSIVACCHSAKLSAFPIATKWCCDEDVKVVRSSAFTQRTCDRCGSL